MKNLSTRARLVLVVLLASLPMLALTTYSALDQRASAEVRAHGEVKMLVRLAAQHQAQIVEGGRQTLVAASQVVSLIGRDPVACSRYFQTLLAETGAIYQSMGLYDANGEPFCTATPAPAPFNVRDRPYFTIARATGRFAIGEYQISRVTGRPGINFGYPLTHQGPNAAVTFLALDLATFQKMAAGTALPPGGVLVVSDRNGTILARYPESQGRVGMKLRPEVLGPLLSGSAGVFEAKGTDDTLRLFAYETAAINPDNSAAIKVAISIPKRVIFEQANRTLMLNLLGLLVATLLLLLAAGYGVERFVLRSIRNLLGAAQRVRSGDLTARTGMNPGKEELSQIGHAFDAMADSLQERDAQLQRALHDLQQQALTDPLTRLLNRRYLGEYLPPELAKAKRRASPVAVLMADLDHFKRINDTHGHAAGDLVLREIAALLKSNIRAGDVAVRWGGEEFLIVLPEATVKGALDKAELIRSTIAGLALSYDGKPLGSLSASFGVAVFPQHGETAEDLIRAADEALYAGKAAGRNRVVLAPAPVELLSGHAPAG